MKLKKFKPVFSEDDQETGVSVVSMVENPAIQEAWVKLNKQIQLSQNGDKQWVTGPVLIPGKEIYRQYDEVNDGEPFNLVFSAEDIERVMLKFHRNQYTHNTNDEHSIPLDSNYAVESWIITDPEKDKSVALGFEGLPPGTWMLTYKIEDQDYWENEIKTGNRTGFSIEGLFGFQEVQMKKKNNVKLQEHSLNDGTVIMINPINRKVAYENGGLLPDGIYVLDDGTMFKVENYQSIWEVKPEELEASNIKLTTMKKVVKKSKIDQFTDQLTKVVASIFGETEAEEVQEVESQEEAQEENQEEEAEEPAVETDESAEQSELDKLREENERLKAQLSEEPKEDPRDKEINELKAQVAKLSKGPAAKKVEKETVTEEPEPQSTPEMYLAKAKVMDGIN